MSIKVGDKVKLIDKFYEHEKFKGDKRHIRKQIASLKGKEFEVYAIDFGRAHTATDIIYTIPVELLEKVEELPKPGDLFRVIGNKGNYHRFELGEIVRLVNPFDWTYDCICKGYSKHHGKVRDQVVRISDIKPYTKHRYTDEQIAEAQRIIGEIIAKMAWPHQITFDLIDGNIIELRCKNRYENTRKVFIAKCSPSDEYNETIGKMVCLCKAAHRKLPDWI